MCANTLGPIGISGVWVETDIALGRLDGER